MKRVPVHFVTGPARASVTELVVRLTASRGNWRSLAPRACPCCVGRAELQVTLARLLREEQPARVLVEIANPEHLGAAQRVLAEWPLGPHVEISAAIELPRDARLTPEELETA